MIIFEWLEDVGFWPAQASSYAAVVDSILLGFSLVLLLFTLPVFIFMSWFAIKYRAGSPADRSGGSKGSLWIEAAWSIVPLAILAVFFVQAARAFFVLETEVAGALRIDVVAKQWMWKFQHPSGKRQINQLNVPVHTPIELTMISQDVIHSLYLPALRIKRDALPQRYTTLRFEANRTGSFHLTCAEYCGTNHSRMGGRIIVMTKQAYEDWVAAQNRFEAPVAKGRRLYRTMDCDACHNGPDNVGPELAGLFGSRITLASGESVLADERYLRDSLVHPNHEVVNGYEPIMPTYRDALGEQDMRDLIAYIRFLSRSPRTAQ